MPLTKQPIREERPNKVSKLELIVIAVSLMYLLGHVGLWLLRVLGTAK